MITCDNQSFHPATASARLCLLWRLFSRKFCLHPSVLREPPRGWGLVEIFNQSHSDPVFPPSHLASSRIFYPHAPALAEIPREGGSTQFFFNQSHVLSLSLIFSSDQPTQPFLCRLLVPQTKCSSCSFKVLRLDRPPKEAQLGATETLYTVRSDLLSSFSSTEWQIIPAPKCYGVQHSPSMWACTTAEHAETLTTEQCEYQVSMLISFISNILNII